MIVPIEDSSDQRLADYRDLTDARLFSERGLFMAEGRFIIRTMLTASPYRPRSVLVTEPAYDSLRDLLDPSMRDHPDQFPVYLATQDIMNQIAGFNIHRGCLAACIRPAPSDPLKLIESLGKGPRTLLLLEDLRNHDNVGGIFRNAAAFGAAAVMLSPQCADPLYRKSIRVSMGGVLQIPFASFSDADWPAALQQLRDHNFSIIALTPSCSAIDIQELGSTVPRPTRSIILLGSEGPGLSAAALAAADLQLRIPIRPEVDSLNVATAAAIALHRLSGL